MEKEFIYHICKAEDWYQRPDDMYEAASLKTEGFIHCSTKEQLAETLKRHYAGVEGLVLLKLDTARLGDRLKWELAPTVGEEFPHIYGQIAPPDVVDIDKLG